MVLPLFSVSGEIIEHKIGIVEIIGHLIQLHGGSPLDVIRQHHTLFGEHIRPAVGSRIDAFLDPAHLLIRQIADDVVRHPLLRRLSLLTGRIPSVF